MNIYIVSYADIEIKSGEIREQIWETEAENFQDFLCQFIEYTGDYSPIFAKAVYGLTNIEDMVELYEYFSARVSGAMIAMVHMYQPKTRIDKDMWSARKKEKLVYQNREFIRDLAEKHQYPSLNDCINEYYLHHKRPTENGTDLED